MVWLLVPVTRSGCIATTIEAKRMTIGADSIAAFVTFRATIDPARSRGESAAAAVTGFFALVIGFFALCYATSCMR
jgi:hypothetical protein